MMIYAALVGLAIFAAGAALGWIAARRSRRPLSAPMEVLPPAPDLAAVQRNGERLAASQEQLVTVERELNALIYSVSHDVRAPLRSIDGFSQALVEDYGEVLDETAHGYVSRVRANTRRITDYIEQLLTLSRLSRAEMRTTSVDLTALATQLCEGCARTAPDRTVAWTVSPGLTASGDQRLITDCLRRILENAWKFTSTRDAARVEVGERSAGVYFVRDNGAGFDMNYAGKLFGAFQRMHPPDEFPGAGIGLAVAQRIVHRHGGRIWVEAAPDAGATFFFTLDSATHAGPGARDARTRTHSQPDRKPALQPTSQA